jgi:type IV secretion system protein VirB10
VKAVVIERPDDPTAVLYRTQPILGELMDAIHSDIPGQVRVLVTSPVTDKLGQRTVLIPQHSVILAMQSGKVAFGDQRLAMGQLEIQFPDGGIATLATSQLADRAGAAGVPADVNNHYGKLLLAAGISALLNVGTQAAVGNSTNYQPTFEQNMARDLGRSVQQTGEKVVNKQLEVPPTLEVPAGTPVTIQLMQNYRLVR